MKDIPRKIANIVLKSVLDNFDKESFDGNSWQPRKNNYQSGRKLLVKSGDLRRSIRIRKVSKKIISLATNVPYAQVHNEGLKAGRGAGFEMPKRTFFDIDEKTKNEINKMIDFEVRKTLNKIK